MNLKEILVGIEGLKAKGELDLNIDLITADSREVKENTLFIAIEGFETDGHKYVKNAIDSGATAILVNESKVRSIAKDVKPDTTVIAAPDTRIATSIAASNFYGNPSKGFKLVGVTGTKGKTTTTFMIKKILEEAGYKVGLVGTVQII